MSDATICRVCGGAGKFYSNHGVGLVHSQYIFPPKCKCDICDGIGTEQKSLTELPNLIYYANYLIARAIRVRKNIHDLK